MLSHITRAPHALLKHRCCCVYACGFASVCMEMCTALYVCSYVCNEGGTSLPSALLSALCFLSRVLDDATLLLPSLHAFLDVSPPPPVV